MDEQVKTLVEVFAQIPSALLSNIKEILRSDNDQRIIANLLITDHGSSIHIKKLSQLILEEQLNPKEIALIFDSFQAYHDMMPKNEVSLVWSGPNLHGVPMRMTMQVVLEMIDQSKKQLFLSSFSFYKIASVIDSFERAIARGVKLSLLLETPQSSHYKIKWDPLKDFNEYIQSNASFYIWPYRNRMINGDEQTGSLHAKFILQDNSKLFISSANLTQAAMDRNIELGVIIEAQDVIGKLQNQIDSLIKENVITRLK